MTKKDFIDLFWQMDKTGAPVDMLWPPIEAAIRDARMRGEERIAPKAYNDGFNAGLEKAVEIVNLSYPRVPNASALILMPKFREAKK